MNWLIAADSSCDLHTMETGAKDIVFHTVPFTVTLDHKEYRDTDDLDIPEMVDVMERSAVCRTACPSVGAWFELFERAEQTIALTISSRLSGSYSSAMVARELVLEAHPEKRRALIAQRWPKCDIQILPTRGLDSFYAERNGLIMPGDVAFRTHAVYAVVVPQPGGKRANEPRHGLLRGQAGHSHHWRGLGRGHHLLEGQRTRRHENSAAHRGDHGAAELHGRVCSHQPLSECTACREAACADCSALAKV